jgi:hypothetical protein
MESHCNWYLKKLVTTSAAFVTPFLWLSATFGNPFMTALAPFGNQEKLKSIFIGIVKKYIFKYPRNFELTKSKNHKQSFIK